MRRRALLSALPLSTTALAGCASQGGSDDDDSVTPTQSRTAPSVRTSERAEGVSPDPDDPVLFVVRNELSERHTVTVTLTRAGETLVEERATLGPDESVEYDPDIRTTGTYELTVAVAGSQSESWEWYIGAFSIRNGSNHFVEILPEEIRFYYEE